MKKPSGKNGKGEKEGAAAPDGSFLAPLATPATAEAVSAPLGLSGPALAHITLIAALPVSARLLLDTHCWLWLFSAPEKLSTAALELLQDAGRPMYLSSACAWEVSIKAGMGKLDFGDGQIKSPRDFVRAALDEMEAVPLPIHHDHALRVADLPSDHRDPFDRILIAQALVEPDMYLVTADGKILGYEGVRLIRAD